MNRGSTTTYTSRLIVEECCACGVLFGLSDELQRELAQSHRQFFCPNGHGQSYVGKTEAEKLRVQLESQRTTTEFWRDEHAREKRQHSATKGQLTKARRRIGRGVCPCCNRSFPALAEHMRTEHPEMAES